MAYTIGGELGLSLSAFSSLEEKEFLPYENKKYHYLLDTGRSALYLALVSILREGGKRKAWLPYYCCDSVRMPFLQSGFSIQYYSMGEGLKNPRLPVRLNGGTLLFINYFGKKSIKIISSLQTLRQNHSGFIIEDNVPSSLNLDAASPHSDYIITSYRKFLPQPDGALLACDVPVEYNLLPVDETFLSQKIIGKILRAECGRSEDFLPLLSESENRLDSLIQPRSMSYLSRYLFKRNNIAEISELRRRNWFILHKLMQTAAFESRMNPLFDNLQPGEVPLGFPITISPALRNDLRQHLVSRNIFCAVHWPLPPTDDLEFAADVQLSNSILTLPIDQRVTPEALNYMAEQIKEFLSHYSK